MSCCYGGKEISFLKKIFFFLVYGRLLLGQDQADLGEGCPLLGSLMLQHYKMKLIG